MFLSFIDGNSGGVGAYGLTILTKRLGFLSRTFRRNETNVIAENKPADYPFDGGYYSSGSRENPLGRK